MTPAAFRWQAAAGSRSQSRLKGTVTE